MILEGTVTSVANFGAFVDIGVHQDGLVHVSQLADHFVKYPSALVKAGDVVKVRVVEVDLKRKRIALSMRKDEAPPHRATAASNEEARGSANPTSAKVHA
jgi:protein Tex